MKDALSSYLQLQERDLQARINNYQSSKKYTVPKQHTRTAHDLG